MGHTLCTTCNKCGKRIFSEWTKGQFGGTGYGTIMVDGREEKHCYDCCGEEDKKHMLDNGKIVLYLTNSPEWFAKITNWPGTLVFKPLYVSKGRHNIARTRYDTKFVGPDGFYWVGVTYGDNTQIHHCRRTKQKP